MKTAHSSIPFDEIRGDLTAAPGSEPWSVAVKFELQQHLKDHQSNVHQLEGWWKLFVEHCGWVALRREDGDAFQTLEEFCAARYPWGLEYNPELIDAVIHERKTAQAVARAAKPIAKHGGDRKTEQVNNVNLKSSNELGPTVDYLAARIARDRPDIHERMKAGEYRSVRQAALEAGIVRPAFTCPADPERAARTIIRHFDAEQRRRLIELLQQSE